MKILLALVIALLAIVIFNCTRHLWDRPKDTVDMLQKFDTIVKKGYALGEGGRIIELRENFVKVGFRNAKGEKAYMVKQRPDKEFRVLYTSTYDPDYQDLKFNHVYPDGTDQNEIIAQFEKEIAESLVPRKK